jgi:hypothetical protein
MHDNNWTVNKTCAKKTLLQKQMKKLLQSLWDVASLNGVYVNALQIQLVSINPIGSWDIASRSHKL